jgi:magnesium chelatase family protein
MQNQRFSKVHGISSNSQMEAAHMKEFCTLKNDSTELLQRSYDKYQFSARTHNKILKIARTFADLDGAPTIEKNHLILALMARDLDKEKTTLMVGL